MEWGGKLGSLGSLNKNENQIVSKPKYTDITEPPSTISQTGRIANC